MSETIGYLMNDAARLFRRNLDARMRELGVTGLQWRIMAYLIRNPGIRQAPLADLLELEPITLSRMVDRLAESGLVERRPDPSDRRAWMLFLTDKAQPMVDGLRCMAEDVVADAQDGLNKTEREMLLDLMQRIRGNLSRKEMNDDRQPAIA